MSPCTSAFRTSYGFRRQLTLFVVWTFSSSTRDAGRQVSTPSAMRLGSGLAVKPSPNLTRFQLTVAGQLGKEFTVLKSLEVTVVELSKSSTCSG